MLLSDRRLNRAIRHLRYLGLREILIFITLQFKEQKHIVES